VVVLPDRGHRAEPVASAEPRPVPMNVRTPVTQPQFGGTSTSRIY
jgi:hypothetical protein